MKKTLSTLRIHWNMLYSSKIWKIMRLTGLLLIICSFQILAEKSYAQGTRLSLDLQHVAIAQVLNEIENQSDFYFLFNNKLIDVERQVDILANDKQISEILNDLFDDHNVEFIVLDRQIVLSPKEYLANTRLQLQPRTITGTVTDENGELLIGVTVMIKGTTQGSITDIEGKYELRLPEDAKSIIFSYVGMGTQEVPVENMTSIDITMVPDILGLDEVVVIGYGTARKSDLTGAVISVDIEEAAELSNVSVLQAMQGTVPGLNIGAVDAAGETPDLVVRGYNTLSTSSADNYPLVVVDGTIYRGNIGDLNPNDIESVDILKDISAAAIYGAQASNGVILITTKKGSRIPSKPMLTYSAKYSLQTPANNIEPMDGIELEEYVRDGYWLSSRLAPDYLQDNPGFDFSTTFLTPYKLQGWQKGLNRNWWDEFTSNGHINDQNLSVRGSSENLGYFFSGGYTDVEGFIINDEYTRYNLRLNLDFAVNEWLSLGLNSSLVSADHSGIEPTGLYINSPWAPVYNDNGDYNNERGTYINVPNIWVSNVPLQLESEDSDKRLNVFGNAYLDLKIPFISGLSYKFQYSNNYQGRNYYKFDTHNHPPVTAFAFQGEAFRNTYLDKVWSADNIINYKRTFADNHNVDLTLVYGVEKVTNETTTVRAVQFDDYTLGYNYIAGGNPELNQVGSNKGQESSLYQMARLNYNFAGKYMLTGTVRRDGFSGFGTNKKIGVFPSAALGWVASNESFIGDNLPWMNFLKLRASYGVAGRRAVNRYSTRARIDKFDAYLLGDGSIQRGQQISTMANDELGWEETTGINLGLDFGVLDSRVRGFVEYYNNNVENVLYNIQLPTITGFSSILKNISKVHNHGVEFSLTGDVVKTSDLRWSVTGNFSLNRNEIKELIGTGDLVANRLFIGEPQNVIYGYEITGMWQLEDETAGTIPSGFWPGTYKIADLNGDDSYSAGWVNDTISSGDKTILGYADPSYRFSIVSRLDYKNFSLQIIVNSIQGGKDYFWGMADPTASWGGLESVSRFNAPAGRWDYWIPENPDAYYRRLDVGSSYDQVRYDQRNFVRLQDISLSYTFDKSLISRARISGLKVFISGKNLFTFTDWPGWDPETGVGFSHNPRPLMRNFSVGLNVEL